MPSVTLGEIADLVEGEFIGDRARRVGGVRSLTEARPEDLTFLANPKYEHLLKTTRAGVILVDGRIEGQSPHWIKVRDPYYALSQVLRAWFSAVPGPESISPKAEVHVSAKLGTNVRVGAFTTISAKALIGNNVTIFDNVFIGAETEIGDDSIVYPNVTIYHRSLIGARCILHSGVVVGADGYGFATTEGRHHKIPQIGIVRIEDDVEIGANSTIDRAALGETVIGEGTKIDNLVQIAHNVRLGKHCLIVSQVGIAGSTEVGDFSVFGGQSGAAGHLRIGSRVLVGAQSAVMKNWDGPLKIAGSPARPLREHLKMEAFIRRLPEILERMEKLERLVAEKPARGEE